MVEKTMGRGAVIDDTGLYRYSLWRSWDPERPRVAFVMLNPSTADALQDDPTIRRCIGFAQAWKYGSLEVVNLFGYRATDPNELLLCSEPVGPENDDYIRVAVGRAEQIILAWGTKGVLRGRDREVLAYLRECNPYCLAKSKDGHPKHPLYLSGGCERILFSSNDKMR